MRMLGLALAFTIGLAFGSAFAQDDRPVVTFVKDDGSREAFTLELYGGDVPWIRYHDGERGSLGTFRLDVDGESTAIDWRSVLRVDLVQQAMEAVWVFTLSDGRTLEGAVRDEDAFLELSGTGEDGRTRRITAYLRKPETQPFTSILLAPPEDDAER